MPIRAETILLYGASGVGKTSQLFRLCRYFLNIARKDNPNARFRLISADGGGWGPFEKSGYIRDGKVEVFDISKREEALADIRRLGDGYWPINANMENEIFNGSDRCKTQDWENILGYIIEGITSIGTLWIAHCADQTCKMGFEGSYKIKQAEYVMGGTDQGHYGIVQKELSTLIVRGFNALPIKYVLWSALRMYSADKDTGDKLLGPEAVGNKITQKIPSWVGTTFYLESALAMKDDTEFRYVKAHFESGLDAETEMKFIAKCRISEDGYPKLKEKFKKGYVPCVAGKQGVEKYFEEEERIMKEVYG